MQLIQIQYIIFLIFFFFLIVAIRTFIYHHDFSESRGK